MLRVARIVPEFCALITPRGRVTPCAGRNKEFLARGVFYLVNCCTNVVVSCQFAGGIPTHGFANSAAVRPPCFARHDTPLTLQRSAREHVHKGGSGALDATHVLAARPGSQQRRVHLRRSPEAVHGPNPFEPLWQTAHRRIPTEGVRWRASPS